MGVDKNAPLNYKAVFNKDSTTKHLYVKYEDKEIKLSSTLNPNKFLGLDSILQTYGRNGIAFIRNVLGLENYVYEIKPKIPPPIEAQVIFLNQTTPAPEQIENIPKQNLDDTLVQVSESIENLETALHHVGVKDIGVGTDLQLQQEFCDLKRAQKFIGTTRGHIQASTNKISSFNEQITQLTKERERLAFISDGIEDGRIAEINEELKELREQRDLKKKYT